jgi:hypothetical protein
MIRFRRVLAVTCTAAILNLFLAGCSTQQHENAPVNADKARDALRTALESWKKGDKVDSLQSGSPPIYVIDMDWQAGAKLVDFKLVNDGERKDAHLFCPVKLSIRNAAGKEEQREVTYIIATAPNLTVSRKVF